MKRWEKRYIVIMGIVLVLDMLATIGLENNKSLFSVEHFEQIQYVLMIVLLLVPIGLLALVFFHIIMVVRYGIHNTKDCGDGLFQEIDKYKKCWREDRYYYIRQIRIINLYYKPGGKIDELVQNKELDRLYARADFLFTNKTLHGDMMTCLSSLGISIVATFLCQILNEDNILNSNVLLIIARAASIAIGFIVVAFYRYAERGQFGSYLYYVNNYESERLSEKIRKLERDLTMSEDEEPIQKDKQDVIDQLIKLREKTRKKSKKKPKEKPTQEDLEQAIAEVSKLNLRIGELNPQNPAYAKYCKIVTDYNLHSEFAKEDPDNP